MTTLIVAVQPDTGNMLIGEEATRLVLDGLFQSPPLDIPVSVVELFPAMGAMPDAGVADQRAASARTVLYYGRCSFQIEHGGSGL